MKRKVSVGQLISMIGTLILCVGLFCNGFEIISVVVFRIMIAIGIIVHVIALFFILKKNEY